MDIAAGSAICRGDQNYMAQAYMSIPIGITVEGANIMTRSFQVIGQGLTRCHPHMLDLIYSLQSDKPEAVDKFGAQLKKVVGHGAENFALSIGRGLMSTMQVKTRSANAYKNGDKLLSHHEDQLLRLSANFALTADLCFTLGGKLKFEEVRVAPRRPISPSFLTSRTYLCSSLRFALPPPSCSWAASPTPWAPSSSATPPCISTTTTGASRASRR